MERFLLIFLFGLLMHNVKNEMTNDVEEMLNNIQDDVNIILRNVTIKECRVDDDCAYNKHGKHSCNKKTWKCFANEEDIDEEFCKNNKQSEHCKNIGSDIAVDVMTDSNKRSAITTGKWTNGVVPYIFRGVSSTNQALVIRNLKILQSRAGGCVSFVRRTNQARYIIVQSANSGCWSYVGSIRRPQQLNLQDARGGTCMRNGIIQHEFLHALGFHHEQSRPDRDRYVLIQEANIQSGAENNFAKASRSDIQGLTYDFGSVMHYGKTAFSKNGRDTIVSRIAGQSFGQRDGASDLDIEGVKRLYCEATTTRRTTTRTTQPTRTSSPQTTRPTRTTSPQTTTPITVRPTRPPTGRPRPSRPEPIALFRGPEISKGPKKITLSFSPFPEGDDARSGLTFFCARAKYHSELSIGMYSRFVLWYNNQAVREGSVSPYDYLRSDGVKVSKVNEVIYRFSTMKPNAPMHQYMLQLNLTPRKEGANAEDLEVNVMEFSIFRADEMHSQHPCVYRFRSRQQW